MAVAVADRLVRLEHLVVLVVVVLVVEFSVAHLVNLELRIRAAVVAVVSQQELRKERVVLVL